jgi:UDP-galactopyranose mutase
LRWNWVFQRPQHLLTRAAKNRRVFVFEEPLPSDDGTARLSLSSPQPNVTVATPLIPEGVDGNGREAILAELLNELITTKHIVRYLLWYYTPMALPFSHHLSPVATIYDCMDQLSAFAGASARMLEFEQELLSRCDAVFTGGVSLFEAKQPLHDNVHCFPSSVDVSHFSRARTWSQPPGDQSGIPAPRLGYFGVIDERLDLPLIAALAEARPSWQIVLVGPVTKIDSAALPRNANIHYLGAKSYEELPAYVAGWDVALMPFVRNASTRFISPTKTPEYLAAGKPVVSTSIRDVVSTYGEPGYVRIADTAEDFIEAVEQSFIDDPVKRLRNVDAMLSRQSWDETWHRMHAIIHGLIQQSDARSSCLTT